MSTNAFLGVLSLLLALGTPVRGSAGVIPVVHEELTRAWDEFARELHGLGRRLRDHFTAGDPSERPIITLMLRYRDTLGLSSDQVRSLERLRSDFERTAIRIDSELRITEMDLTELLKADPVDLEQVEKKVRQSERLRADLRLARIRTQEQAKAQLSSGQQEKLRDLLADRPHRRLRPEAYRPPR